MVIDEHQEVLVTLAVGRDEGAGDVSVYEAAGVRGLVLRAVVRVPRGVSLCAVGAAHVLRAREVRGSVADHASRAAHRRAPEVEAAVHNGGGDVRG